MLERMWRRQNPLHCWWECKLIQPLWRTVWKFLKKLKIELPYGPEIPHLNIYPEKTIIQKDTCTPVFIVTLFIVAKPWEEHKCPLTEEWIKKMWHARAWNITQPKKNEIMLCAATWMDLEIIILCEVSDRERYISYDITYMWNLIKK